MANLLHLFLRIIAVNILHERIVYALALFTRKEIVDIVHISVGQIA